MRNIKLSGRYAKSLFDLAIEKGQLEMVIADVHLFNETVNSSTDFVYLLKSPIIKPEKKQAIFENIFGNKISALTMTFFKMVIAKGREIFLSDMMAEFVNQYNQLKGITKIKYIGAVAIDNASAEKLKSTIEQKTSLKNIQLTTHVDEKLIGGFVLEYGDKIFDASILHDLNEVRKQFLKNDFVKQF